MREVACCKFRVAAWLAGHPDMIAVIAGRLKRG
jgi:hypothetical protein